MTLLHVPNGYRLAPGITPGVFLPRFAAAMNPVRDGLDADTFIDLAVDSIDRADVNLKPRPAAPMDDAFGKWTAEQADMSRNLVWFDPHSLDVRIGLDTVTGRHHILPATDCLAYLEVLEAMPEIEMYGYQAIIEFIPEGVTDEEWGERAEALTRLLPRGSSAGMDLWTLRGPGDARTAQIVTALQIDGELLASFNPPSLRARAHRQAAEIFARWLHERHGYEMMSAVISAAGMALPALQEAVESRLAPLSADLLRAGTGKTLFDGLSREEWNVLCGRDYDASAAADLAGL
ncbi:hypothetical protein [Arthrobacter caoxuetaonis]|uniref:Uncharacterized protein n=1 Tax=Arthrobacter caoxuetaonis TaxID=2886935 RepID=A0A9X1MHN9_9MICC|nr:hypothetical protein [Arthrobacter caoxuetaonis]MCC3299806.1 hypothetical protein [Arthrobacter caoxuetaonis]USQ59294.1 hypothetical protein NF551_17060 [Arthrobacter caoxuetaonis]